MIPTAVKLATLHKPLIKFVGNRAALVEILKSHDYSQVKPHPCTFDGLLPGSKDCLSVDQVLSKQLPFKVVPYINKNAAQAVAGDSKYNFPPRDLKPGELESIFQLPRKYQYKPIDEAEMDAINNGGAI